MSENGYSVRRELTLDGLNPNVFGYDIISSILCETIGVFEKRMYEKPGEALGVFGTGGMVAVSGC